MLEPREIRSWEGLTDTMLAHAGAEDPEALAQVVAILDRAYALLPAVVAQLREPHTVAGQAQPGYSWAAIGSALGITRQAAQKRFGR